MLNVGMVICIALGGGGIRLLSVFGLAGCAQMATYSLDCALPLARALGNRAPLGTPPLF